MHETEIENSKYATFVIEMKFPGLFPVEMR